MVLYKSPTGELFDVYLYKVGCEIRGKQNVLFMWLGDCFVFVQGDIENFFYPFLSFLSQILFLRSRHADRFD